jgi:hypothetical protein
MSIENQQSLLGFTKEQAQAVEAFLRSCAVPLVGEVEDQLSLLGTGSFFHVEDRGVCLVTAAHVLRQARRDQVDVAVPMRSSSNYATLFAYDEYLPEEDANDYDAAVVVLKDLDIKQQIRADWRVLNGGHPLPATKASNRFVVAGYPRELVAKEGGFTDRAFTQIYTDRYGDRADPARLLLTYRREAQSPEGLRNTPNLEGLSGALVWTILDSPSGGVWTPEQQFRVIGVQDAFKHDEYISVKPWDIVQEIVRRIPAGTAGR